MIVNEICTQDLTPTVLARALGLSLGRFEQHMSGETPSQEVLTNLAALTKRMWHPWKRPEFDVEILSSWWSQWAGRAADEPTEDIEVATWPAATNVTLMTGAQGHKDEVEWCMKVQAFTLSAFSGTWNFQKKDAAEYLARLGWTPKLEWVSTTRRQQHIWRWNPLKLGAPRGKPWRNAYKTQADKANAVVANSMKEAIYQERLARAREALLPTLPAAQGLTIQEACIRIAGKLFKSQKYLQNVRKLLAALGWQYNAATKRWYPTEQAPPRATARSLAEALVEVDPIDGVSLAVVCELVGEKPTRRTQERLANILSEIGWYYSGSTRRWHPQAVIAAKHAEPVEFVPGGLADRLTNLPPKLAESPPKISLLADLLKQ